jgi:MerR family transcriptional regulator, heat shock protein HspR
MPGQLDDLDDPDYTTGRAAEALGVRQAFLRSLDAADVVRPQRTASARRAVRRAAPGAAPPGPPDGPRPVP